MSIKNEFPYKLYLVTDQKACLGRDFFWIVEQAIKGGVDLIQLREKNLEENLFLEKALKLKDLCTKYDVPLIINDNIQIAKKSEAFGLHIGQTDSSLSESHKILGESYPIGLSIDRMEEAEEELIKSAYYLGVGIFSTNTKKDFSTMLGLEGLEVLRKKTKKPLVAIGGIKINNAEEVIKSGADCLAVVSEICSAENPAKASEELRNIIEKLRK